MGAGEQTWGSGSDLQAKPTAKTRKLVADAVLDGAAVQVWTDTHAAGDELEALKGYIRSVRGANMQVEATEGYTVNGRTRGGVVIAWDAGVMKPMGKAAVEVVVPGRVLSVRLTSLQCGAVLRVVGVYAPCRGARRGGGERSGGEAGGAAGDANELTPTKSWPALARTAHTRIILGSEILA